MTLPTISDADLVTATGGALQPSTSTGPTFPSPRPDPQDPFPFPSGSGPKTTPRPYPYPIPVDGREGIKLA